MRVSSLRSSNIRSSHRRNSNDPGPPIAPAGAYVRANPRGNDRDWTLQSARPCIYRYLGWSDLIQQSIDDTSVLEPIRSALAWMLKVRSTATRVQAAYRRAPFSGAYVLQEVAQFSDTIVMSCSPTKDAVGHLLYIAQQFCNRLLLSPSPQFTRGAIVVGDLYHRGNVIFGPALIEAYRLESQVAKHPRVLIAPSVSQLLDIQLAPARRPTEHPVHTDRDGWLFLDALQEAGDTAFYWASTLEASLRRKNKRDLKRPPGAERESILGKNKWMRTYLRDVIRRSTGSSTR